MKLPKEDWLQYQINALKQRLADAGIEVSGITITENGTYDVSGYEAVEVDVPSPKGEIEITVNGTYDIKDYASANINVPIPEGYLKPEGILDITENGTYNITDYEGANVNIKVVFNLQEKSVIPSKEPQEVVADVGYDGLEKVSVGAIPSEYIIPSGEIEITENGTYDVGEYASAKVEIDNGKPIEIDTLDNSLLVSENEGKIYKCDEKLYQVEKIKSLKGLTIRFNERIEHCPLITDDSEFECSGIIWNGNQVLMDEDPYYIHNICKLTKSLPDSYVTGDRFIAFVIRDYAGFYYISADNQEETGWYFYDENGNEWLALYEINKGFNITNFDCPKLNENPEFIKWVLANAKVYPKIESVKDVKAFKNGDSGSDVYSCYLNSIGEVREYKDLNTPIEVQFTASFIKNGELVIKNFNTLHLNVGVDFYTNEGDLLSFETDWDNDTYPTIVKYNGEVLDNNPIFTEFNGSITKTNNFMSYLMECCELVDMEYVNGCYFVEYLTPTGTLDITENGEVDVKEYEKVNVKIQGSGGSVEARVKTNSITITKAEVNIIDDTTIELEV